MEPDECIHVYKYGYTKEKEVNPPQKKKKNHHVGSIMGGKRPGGRAI
jgi:hypothetical protein